MARIIFASAIQHRVPSPEQEVEAESVRAALEKVFGQTPALRDYILDEQGALRRHVAIFIDGLRVRDPAGLGDPVGPSSRIYVVQALSGG